MLLDWLVLWIDVVDEHYHAIEFLADQSSKLGLDASIGFQISKQPMDGVFDCQVRLAAPPTLELWRLLGPAVV